MGVFDYGSFVGTYIRLPSGGTLFYSKDTQFEGTHPVLFASRDLFPRFWDEIEAYWKRILLYEDKVFIPDRALPTVLKIFSRYQKEFLEHIKPYTHNWEAMISAHVESLEKRTSKAYRRYDPYGFTEEADWIDNIKKVVKFPAKEDFVGKAGVFLQAHRLAQPPNIPGVLNLSRWNGWARTAFHQHIKRLKQCLSTLREALLEYTPERPQLARSILVQIDHLWDYTARADIWDLDNERLTVAACKEAYRYLDENRKVITNAKAAHIREKALQLVIIPLTRLSNGPLVDARIKLMEY